MGGVLGGVPWDPVDASRIREEVDSMILAVSMQVADFADCAGCAMQLLSDERSTCPFTRTSRCRTNTVPMNHLVAAASSSTTGRGPCRSKVSALRAGTWPQLLALGGRATALSVAPAVRAQRTVG